MALQPNRRLGPYEILSPLGAGGMGEVYRARDTRLNRDVALKVIPEVFAADADRMSRFEREAKLLASLNHPHIAAIYGVEESGSTEALVMELVEGPTLADRIATGPIPLDEALPIAQQIAEALEYAHDHSVIHRDLKPANIKVTTDGTVKVLDFGLAKALTEEPTAANLSNSPTISMNATVAGVILGTAAYMSPEQARGKTVDRRADIWAFGVVLFEMLTGHAVFAGEDVSETLAFVMTKEPAFDTLPSKAPLAIRTLLRRCLTKDMRQRLQHIGEARFVLEHSEDAAAEPVAAQHKSRERLAWSFAAVLFVALVAALALGTRAYFRSAPQESRPIRFFVAPPEGWAFAQPVSNGGTATIPLAISPDGQRVAFVATGKDGRSLLWVRSLDTLTAQALAGTDGAARPFWSPDSRFLGFFAGGKLKKIDVLGGPQITLCDAPDDRSGTWSRDGVIVFAARLNSALQKVAASGGVPTAATVLGEGESGHRRPYFLPDGRHFLYRAITSSPEGGPIYVASLDSAERKLLFNTDSANVAYSQGHLLFLRETTLMAQPFDTLRLVLTGEAFPIAEQVLRSATTPPYGFFSASENGVLAYQTGTAAGGAQLRWFDRTGKQIGTVGDPGTQSDLKLSPDGNRASISIAGQAANGRDIWLFDLARGLRTRFTFGGSALQETSIWSPDGSRVVFNSNRKVHLDLYQKASSGTGGEELLLTDNVDKYPVSWSPDGRSILYYATGASNSLLFVLSLSGDRKPVPFLNTQFNVAPGQFSPDGRWVAYASDESGKFEVYVAPFLGPGGKWQISTTGGIQLRWRHDGSEIFYIAPDGKLMAAAVNGKGSSFEVGAVQPLFQTRVTGLRYQYDVAADGMHFLVDSTPEQEASAPITVVLNWDVGLKK
jgi:Tol biopolymer transport system component